MSIPAGALYPSRRLSLRAQLLRLIAGLVFRPVLNADLPPAVVRARLLRLSKASRLPLPAGSRIQAAELGGVPVEWMRNDRGTASASLLYLHGGAYVLGAPTMYREMTARLAQAGLDVAVLDYRLAPEHPFPAAVDDALAAYRALLAAGHSPRRLVIGGDSAGGGLTLACALAIRDAGLPQPAALVTLSPWTDLSLSGASHTRLAGQELLLREPLLRRSAAAYLAGATPLHPLASPLFADLHALAPLLIQVADGEILLDDALRLADKARAAGVAVELQVWPRLWHVWQIFAGKMPEADAALAQILRFIREHST
ncbi:MAG: alpha/beta hydrolase [Gammaproteobacteria bacterium]